MHSRLLQDALSDFAQDASQAFQQALAEGEEIPFEPRDMLVDELEEFGRCIADGETPETGGAEGLAALRVVLGAVESARTGRAVDLAAPG